MRLFGSFEGCSIEIPPVRDGLVVLFLSSYKGGNKMTPKERLLQMQTYEEFDRNRHLIDGMLPDKEIIEHLTKITPKVSNTKEELYKIPPSKGGTIGCGLRKEFEK